MNIKYKTLISIIGFLLLQEVVFRVFFPLPELSNFDRALYVPKKNDFQGGFVRNKSFQWWSKPDTTAPFHLNYNKYGFRDDDWSIEKTPSKKRVIFIGDSFVEGIMANDNQTIPDFFEEALSQLEIEAMNFGMLGTGIEEYLQLIADAVPIFKPDAVVLVIYANDFSSKEVKIPSHNLQEQYYDWTTPRIIELLNQYKGGNPVPTSLMRSSRKVLPDSSQSTYPFRSRIPEMYEHADSILVSHMLKAEFNPYKLNEIMRMERGLREPCDLLVPLDFFRYYAEKFDFRPLVLFIPCRHQLTNHYLQYENEVSRKFEQNISLTDSIYQVNVQTLTQNCERLGLDFINSKDTLQSMETRNMRAYWNYDDHMKAEGYKAVSAYLAEELSFWKRN